MYGNGNNSMPFLGNENLTFHRFSDGTVSVSGHQFSPDGKRPSVSSHQSDFVSPIWTTDTYPSAVATNIEFQYVTPNEHTKNLHNNTSTAKLMESTVEDDDQSTKQVTFLFFSSRAFMMPVTMRGGGVN